MLIADNVIKYHLENVYFVSGGACGGKTTVTEYLAEKYGMVLYSWDEHYSEYHAIADPKYQPTLSRRKEVTSWEEYFMQPVEEYAESLRLSIDEQIGMVVADLIRVVGSAEGQKVIVDGFFPARVLRGLSEWSRVVFLLATEEVVRKDYFRREDKQDMLRCIQGLQNPQAALDNVFRTLGYRAEEDARDIGRSGFRFFVREAVSTDPAELIEQVEAHFRQGGLA